LQRRPESAAAFFSTAATHTDFLDSLADARDLDESDFR